MELKSSSDRGKQLLPSYVCITLQLMEEIAITAINFIERRDIHGNGN